MSKSFPVFLVPLAWLLFAGSALAQSNLSPNSSGVDTVRADRRCTSATLSSDPLAPCSDDVLNDRPRAFPEVVRTPGNNMLGSGILGAGFPGNSMGTMGTPGIPSTGMMNSGASSNSGAMGAGAASPSGAVPATSSSNRGR